jgi:hypothetical protein
MHQQQMHPQPLQIPDDDIDGQGETTTIQTRPPIQYYLSQQQFIQFPPNPQRIHQAPPPPPIHIPDNADTSLLTDDTIYVGALLELRCAVFQDKHRLGHQPPDIFISRVLACQVPRPGKPYYRFAISTPSNDQQTSRDDILYKHLVSVDGIPYLPHETKKEKQKRGFGAPNHPTNLKRQRLGAEREANLEVQLSPRRAGGGNVNNNIDNDDDNDDITNIPIYSVVVNNEPTINTVNSIIQQLHGSSNHNHNNNNHNHNNNNNIHNNISQLYNPSLLLPSRQQQLSQLPKSSSLEPFNPAVSPSFAQFQQQQMGIFIQPVDPFSSDSFQKELDFNRRVQAHREQQQNQPKSPTGSTSSIIRSDLPNSSPGLFNSVLRRQGGNTINGTHFTFDSSTNSSNTLRNTLDTPNNVLKSGLNTITTTSILTPTLNNPFSSSSLIKKFSADHRLPISPTMQIKTAFGAKPSSASSSSASSLTSTAQQSIYPFTPSQANPMAVSITESNPHNSISANTNNSSSSSSSSSSSLLNPSRPQLTIDLNAASSPTTALGTTTTGLFSPFNPKNLKSATNLTTLNIMQTFSNSKLQLQQTPHPITPQTSKYYSHPFLPHLNKSTPLDVLSKRPSLTTPTASSSSLLTPISPRNNDLSSNTNPKSPMTSVGPLLISPRSNNTGTSQYEFTSPQQSQYSLPNTPKIQQPSTPRSLLLLDQAITSPLPLLSRNSQFNTPQQQSQPQQQMQQSQLHSQSSHNIDHQQPSSSLSSPQQFSPQQVNLSNSFYRHGSVSSLININTINDNLRAKAEQLQQQQQQQQTPKVDQSIISIQKLQPSQQQKSQIQPRAVLSPVPPTSTRNTEPTKLEPVLEESSPRNDIITPIPASTVVPLSLAVITTAPSTTSLTPTPTSAATTVGVSSTPFTTTSTPVDITMSVSSTSSNVVVDIVDVVNNVVFPPVSSPHNEIELSQNDTTQNMPPLPAPAPTPSPTPVIIRTNIGVLRSPRAALRLSTSKEQYNTIHNDHQTTFGGVAPHSPSNIRKDVHPNLYHEHQQSVASNLEQLLQEEAEAEEKLLLSKHFHQPTTHHTHQDIYNTFHKLRPSPRASEIDENETIQYSHFLPRRSPFFSSPRKSNFDPRPRNEDDSDIDSDSDDNNIDYGGDGGGGGDDDGGNGGDEDNELSNSSPLDLDNNLGTIDEC